MQKRRTLKELIVRSHAIKPDEKSVYLAALGFLKEDRKKAIREVLEKEIEEIGRVRAEAEEKKNALGEKYIRDLKKLFAIEQKKAMVREEEAEDVGAEDILNQLNSL